jgi:hypothetical protein
MYLLRIVIFLFKITYMILSSHIFIYSSFEPFKILLIIQIFLFNSDVLLIIST